MAVAGEWQSLENGSRWRLGVAGEWESLEIGSRQEPRSNSLPKGLGGNSTFHRHNLAARFRF
jgi:hypothetical protein